MDIRDCSFSYLTRKSRTTGEVEQYLREKGFTGEQVQEELVFLAEFRYLDDAAYCLRYLEQAFAKGRGLVRIGNELREKGISPDLIEDAVFEYGISDQREFEKQRALEQAKRAVQGEAVSDKLLAKIGRKLFAQGFDSDTIYYAVGQVMKLDSHQEF